MGSSVAAVDGTESVVDFLNGVVPLVAIEDVLELSSVEVTVLGPDSVVGFGLVSDVVTLH